MPYIQLVVLRARRAPLIAALHLLMLAVAGIPSQLVGQISHGWSETMVYATVGFGTGSMAVAGQAALSVHAPVGEFTLRLAGVGELNILGPSNDASDVALLYGIRRVAGTTWVSLGAGPAIARATLYGSCLQLTGWLGCGSYQVDTRSAVGLGFDASVGWAATRGFGLGITVLGDANGAHSFLAVTLNMQLGKVR